MMDEFRADIHCHSDCSDGTDSPEKLLHLAVAAGLQGLSITDHDTVDAYTPELFAEANRIGLKLLTGIELSSEIEETSVHVLGYNFNPYSSSLKTFLLELQKRRAARNRAILMNLTQRNLPISEKELHDYAARVREKRTIGRPHIAALMLEKGYVHTLQEAFEVYLKQGACCYAPGIKFTPYEAIQQIRLADGKAVLAHPHFLRKGQMTRQILSLPFDGIECYYSRLPKEQERPWLELAKQKGWIATGGSDYHGSFKPNIPLGCSWVNEATFAKLLS
ncbi:MAG: PHP domain-containing protein [Verrucomicrobia bacterium]|nr:PHP domain-containing protein [Verrucomicrobiota bacterium]